MYIWETVCKKELFFGQPFFTWQLLHPRPDLLVRGAQGADHQAQLVNVVLACIGEFPPFLKKIFFLIVYFYCLGKWGRT